MVSEQIQHKHREKFWTILVCVSVLPSSGKNVYDERAELVCVKPFPSMPVFFWNDENGIKYKKAYFGRYPG